MDSQELDLSGQIMKEYKDGLNYQKTMQFSTKWPEYERFKAGDQWPPVTEKTKSLPRPVFNIIRFILNHKTSSVMNENIKMVFSPEEVPEETVEGLDNKQSSQIDKAVEAADKFSKFSDATWERIKQDELNEEFLDDAGTLGTGILHYFWDDFKTGGTTLKYKGDMDGEVLDPINCFFGNPQLRNVQKQPYIIISSRESIKSVKDEAKLNKIPIEKIEMIVPDKNTTDEGYDSAQKELIDSQKTTVLTKYWKENGLIYFTKVCSNVTFKPKTNTEFELYPIEAMPWEKRKKAINGVSEVEGLVPNQKSMNFLIAMMLLSAQETAWPKLLAKDGALQSQRITNTPGEIITDYNPPMNGDGIKFMQPPQMSNFVPNLVDKVMEFTRTLTGASEVATGDPFTKQLNAAAIIALQNQAKIPIDQIKKRFHRSMENVGRIWEQFYKVKYNMNRVVTVKDENNKEIPMEFNGSDYKDVNLRLKIDIGSSSSFSESLMMTNLDRFLDQKLITFEQYLKYAPQNVVPFKNRLLKEIEEQKAMQEEMALNAQNNPQIPNQQNPMNPNINQPQQPDIEQVINEALTHMTPEEQAKFNSLSEEQRFQIIQKMLQG